MVQPIERGKVEVPSSPREEKINVSLPDRARRARDRLTAGRARSGESWKDTGAPSGLCCCRGPLTALLGLKTVSYQLTVCKSAAAGTRMPSGAPGPADAESASPARPTVSTKLGAPVCPGGAVWTVQRGGVPASRRCHRWRCLFLCHLMSCSPSSFTLSWESPCQQGFLLSIFLQPFGHMVRYSAVTTNFSFAS